MIVNILRAAFVLEWSPLLETDTLTGVQTLDEAVFILHSGNSVRKDMNQNILVTISEMNLDNSYHLGNSGFNLTLYCHIHNVSADTFSAFFKSNSWVCIEVQIETFL